MVHSFLIRFIISMVILSFLILSLYLLKKLLKKHISIKWQYKLWYLLPVMLLIPFLPNQIWQSKSFFQWSTRLAEQVNTTSHITENLQSVGQNANWFQDFTTTVNHTSLDKWNWLVLGLWLLGIIMMVIFQVVGNRRLNTIRKSIVLFDNPEMEGLFEDCKATLSIKKKLIFGKSSLVHTPMTFDIFKPIIVLPDLPFSKTDLRNILLHELVHYKHKDILINYVMCVFQAIYWFNPIVWFANKEMRADREIACDAVVLDLLDNCFHANYGHTIIRFANTASQQSNLSFAADFGGAKKQIKKRIEKIVDHSKESRLLQIKSIIIFFLLTCMVIGQAPILSVMAKDNHQYNLKNEQIKAADLSSYFDGIDGSFVLYDTLSEQYTIHNVDKSRTRISPDSTYKIYSALMGLESGVITRENSHMQWNGTKYIYPEWNKDQDLATAMSSSVNWYFQKLDQQVGFKKLTAYFKKLKYGNKNLSGGLSDFWMESTLKISPIEQVQLLKDFYTNEQQFSDRSIQTVKQAIRIDERNCAILSGKTGTGSVNGKNRNGWFIGYVEKDDRVYFFATNIQDKDDAYGSKAADITLSILKDKNIYK